MGGNKNIFKKMNIRAGAQLKIGNIQNDSNIFDCIHDSKKDTCAVPGQQNIMVKMCVQNIGGENAVIKDYKLTFKVTNKFHNDKIYLAHSYPYTYSKLCTKINNILKFI